MTFESFFPFIFFAIFFLVAGSFVVKIFKHGGFKAAMFGAPIESTVGEVAGGGGKLMNLSLKVHRLGGGSSEKAIGLEFAARSFASYQMLPVTLSKAEAQRLSQLLQSALAGRNAA
ncbi:hypothetical protein [Stagnimonas aquatica]|uniref:hypothetical protein n=1 Tax=Stagnimonas aquatica TaxID=2689987 RepID=UPI0013151444|nr:hypothetical protein [Stagnimonas aquatica]